MVWDGIEKRARFETCSLHEVLEKRVTEVHDAIYGNGNPEEGLLWIAKENRSKINGNTQFIDMVKKHFWKLVAMSAIGVVAAVFNMIVEILKSHIILR